MKNKTVICTKARLWRSNDEIDKLLELDNKYTNYTHSVINAEILNLTKEQQEKVLH